MGGCRRENRALRARGKKMSCRKKPPRAAAPLSSAQRAPSILKLPMLFAPRALPIYAVAQSRSLKNTFRPQTALLDFPSPPPKSPREALRSPPRSTAPPFRGPLRGAATPFGNLPRRPSPPSGSLAEAFGASSGGRGRYFFAENLQLTENCPIFALGLRHIVLPIIL